jgi:hypothetical protein
MSWGPLLYKRSEPQHFLKQKQALFEQQHAARLRKFARFVTQKQTLRTIRI